MDDPTDTGEEPPRDLAGIAQRILSSTRDQRISLHSVQWQSVFRPNIRLAEHYRRGRVFLAGDAAHVHTPAGAQGLNTGVQDAYNLGWKLAQVLAGADDGLLDTYEAERLPIAAGVLGLSTKKYKAIVKLDPSAIRRGKGEQQLALTYQGGPLAIDGDRTKTLCAGDRAPDAMLRDAKGRDVRLFETFSGPHFTAIAYRPRSADELSRFDWPAAGASLKRVVIDGTGSAADYVRSDPAGTFRKAYSVSADALLLARPDGYLAHIATRDMLTMMRCAARSLTPHASPSRDPRSAEVQCLTEHRNSRSDEPSTAVDHPYLSLRAQDQDRSWEAFQNINHRRRAIRDFDGADIPVEHMQSLLTEAARAPSSGNLQPYQFHWVRAPDLRTRVAAACNGQRAAASASTLVVVAASREIALETATRQLTYVDTSNALPARTKDYHRRQLERFRRILQVVRGRSGRL